MHAAFLDYDYLFSENGLVAHKEGKLIGNQVLNEELSFYRIFRSRIVAKFGSLGLLDLTLAALSSRRIYSGVELICECGFNAEFEVAPG